MSKKYKETEMVKIVKQYVEDNFRDILDTILIGKKTKRFRKSKPSGPSEDTGVIQYIWRMMAFYNGTNNHIPMTAHYDLWSWIESNISTKEEWDATHDTDWYNEKNNVEKYLDDLAIYINQKTGLGFGGMEDWARAFGYIE